MDVVFVTGYVFGIGIGFEFGANLTSYGFGFNQSTAGSVRSSAPGTRHVYALWATSRPRIPGSSIFGFLQLELMEVNFRPFFGDRYARSRGQWAGTNHSAEGLA
ncbi:hypothetical protein F0562_001589 [Nyssa sinensis]|uniref:Uncharacterized protein n=1 Tax=Nyssa sinensis TaxID=561372 RepID=A0A5J5C3I2_9ASTE|nr:hypothetical protein F0562_001589 [Nyssa sinensis]